MYFSIFLSLVQEENLQMSEINFKGSDSFIWLISYCMNDSPPQRLDYLMLTEINRSAVK